MQYKGLGDPLLPIPEILLVQVDLDLFSRSQRSKLTLDLIINNDLSKSTSLLCVVHEVSLSPENMNFWGDI